jgi:hypothetical protein
MLQVKDFRMILGDLSCYIKIQEGIFVQSFVHFGAGTVTLRVVQVFRIQVRF